MKKILFAYARGGAPVDYAFPRIAACGELHVLALTPLPMATMSQWGPCCASIVDRSAERLRGEMLVDALIDRAKAIGADALMCLSEFAVLAVARAADRLCLPGADSGAARRSRDKRLMRETWREAGVPIPAFRRVDSAGSLRRAFTELRPPLLLKPAWGAGSIGQLVLHEESDVTPAWQTVSEALRKADGAGYGELYEAGADSSLLVEEIVNGATDGWYQQPGYGDYLSVEGIVAAGTYHPICITARIPTIPPFTELSNNAPCVLPEPLQRRIEQVACRSVSSLSLGTCGTHTEIKLAANGELYVIESAARFGGCMVVREIETVFGLDPIAMLTRQLLGEHVSYPPRMLVEGHRAAASLALIPTDAAGRPWTTTPVWDSQAIQWDRLISPGSTIETVKGLTVPDGTRIPPYDPSAGAGNWAGIFFVTASDADVLLADCHSVLNGLEGALGDVTERRPGHE
jgi:biotin carboxylase